MNTQKHASAGSHGVMGRVHPYSSLRTSRRVVSKSKRKNVMNLSPKTTRFIIEALEHYQTSHEERLRDERLTEDEIADLTNDCQYLEAIKTDLKKYHGELLHKLSSHVQES